MLLITSCAGQVPFTEETLLQHGDSVSFRESVRLTAGSSKSKNEEIINGKFTSPASGARNEICHQRHAGSSIHEGDGSPTHSSAEPLDGKHARASKDGLRNGHLDHKSSKEDELQRGELGYFKGNERLKGDYDNEVLEFNGEKTSIHKKNTSSDSGGGKYRTSGSSPSYRYRSPSRSSGRTHSIIEEYAHSKGRNPEEHGHRTDYDLDEERMAEYGRERRHRSRDLVADDRREHSSSFYSREASDRGRSKDRDVDRDLRREKERERSRNREGDRVLRREKERERSHERDRRNAEKDRSRGREVDRDRRRERERDRSWETVAERSRRDRERERSRDRVRGGERDRMRESERDKLRERERERRDDRNRHRDRDTPDNDRHLGYDDRMDSIDSRDRHRYSRHSRQEEMEKLRDRKRNSEPVKGDNSMDTSLEGGDNTLERYIFHV